MIASYEAEIGNVRTSKPVLPRVTLGFTCVAA